MSMSTRKKFIGISIVVLTIIIVVATIAAIKTASRNNMQEISDVTVISGMKTSEIGDIEIDEPIIVSIDTNIEEVEEEVVEEVENDDASSYTTLDAEAEVVVEDINYETEVVVDDINYDVEEIVYPTTFSGTVVSYEEGIGVLIRLDAEYINAFGELMYIEDVNIPIGEHVTFSCSFFSVAMSYPSIFQGYDMQIMIDAVSIEN